MSRLGDKNEARRMAREANVPVVPGSEGLIPARPKPCGWPIEIGFPVLIKATAGGGGRGMRVAANDLSLKSALQQAAAEAEAAFGNAGIYLERYIERPRHVEVQIIADHHGNVVPSLGARLLRAAAASKADRGKPVAGACQRPRVPRCAKRPCGWSKAPTTPTPARVEFIVDQSGNFYFIEVNARIQVEHPVTEMVTGIDLIKTQIRVAAGEPLPFKQEDVHVRGAAIECRINAEDTSTQFSALARDRSSG